jgi:hypothetical protein
MTMRWAAQLGCGTGCFTTDNAAIVAAFMIRHDEIVHDTVAHVGAVYAAIAADMHDFVPCSEEAFHDELDRRYGLSRHESDEDLDTHLDIFDAIVTDEPKRRNAPFLWVCDDSVTPWQVTIEHAP